MNRSRARGERLVYIRRVLRPRRPGLSRMVQVLAFIRTAKRFYTVAQGRPELARGAPWVRIKKQSVTPQALHNQS